MGVDYSSETENNPEIANVNNNITINTKEEEKESTKVNSFHISCRSDQYTGSEDMTGIILYYYNGKTSWTMGNITCRTGYVYICKNNRLKYQTNESIYLQCCKRLLFGIQENYDYSKFKATGIRFDKTNKKWTTTKTAIRLFDHHHPRNSNEINENEDENYEKIWLDILLKEWINSNYTKQTIFTQPAVWSWYKDKWIHYDIDTIKYIEEEYKNIYSKNVQQASTEISIKLTDPNNHSKIFNNPENTKTYGKYEMYFETTKISLNPTKIHSRQNPRWKNDTDITNSYHLQKNCTTKKYRIVRRKDMNQ